MGTSSADPLSRRVLRVSMGASFVLKFVVSHDLSRDVATLQRQFGVQTWATVVDRDAEPLDSLPGDRDVALVLGNEGHGLAPEWIDRCDRRVTIPMRAGQDSLNVAVASGIFLYHLRR